MTLFLCAQDLHFFWIGLMKEQTFSVLEKKEVPPEQYLASVALFLEEQHLMWEEVDDLCVVTGPGSFTAIRVSLTLANTVRFVYNMPLYCLENPSHLFPRELVAEGGRGILVADQQFAHASYDRPPNITKAFGV